ncbi:alpha/beta fold hydrolase [Desulfosediminicola flagellatus]|uniref:alpha/beta fold hydrolase n=1 Tax=Desulfosediminicola flagellatus TaxID=2569541 RepID=UPI0010ACF1CB|nr:alpha/beta hydrolase [Desulfosediminicola flagellatus]
MHSDTTPKLKAIPFNCDSYIVNGISLSFLDSGGEKPPLHFYHANGFPVSVYLPLLIKLTKHFRVVGLSIRGQDSQTAGNTSWHRIADDLIGFLDAKQLSPVLGVGHSVGGVTTMIAAAKRPDLFSKIILIDPVIHPYNSLLSQAVMRVLGKKSRFMLARLARARRRHWANREEVYNYFKGKSLFKRFNDEYLRSYVTYGVRPSASGGMELLCPPEAEARTFENYPLDVWFWVQRLKTHALILRGEYSEVLTDDSVNRFCRKTTSAESCLVQGAGHLIPMEKPEEVIAIINAN